MEEREINLKHLFFSICKKWKQILVCALIGAIVCGAYGYHKGKAVVKVIDEEKLIQKEEALAKRQAYLENSVFMRNPNAEIWQRTLQIDISVNNENSKNLMKVFETYANALRSEELYKLIAKEVGEESPEYIYELISMTYYNKDGDYYSFKNDLQGNTILSFMVMLRGLDDKYTLRIADILENFIKKQKLINSEYICQHNIDIFNICSVITGNYLEKYSTVEKELSNLEKELTQLKVSNNKPYKSLKKWIVLGLLVGSFILIGYYTMLYILSDKLHEANEIESLWGIKTWRRNAGEDDNLKEILKAIILTKEEYSIIMAAGTYITDNLKAIVNEANNDLKKEKTVIYEDVINNPAAIKALSNANAVILLETEEKSKISDIAREVKLFMQNNIPVIGCVVDGEK